ncbi:hypothetical protein BU25DRAFT_424446 [Macroventuria anomochaeta]|uniref:Uncharacterized protein n=1 Tax=Macroventuria anomochaeta TaxID=301207 RepID=A0ACB6RQS5_9PLEO|nr:uncharacterized protein BU25DRAFT_424446 [Macroventuria anomochaeta]KAF2624062.1 hypothetical protein BU25DRAFT_424446 [Macroventuria anomochaeta]
MATIYGCATLTIIAPTGKRANPGLAGVSVPRPTQVKKTIEGYNFFTIPPEILVERTATDWSTRAWTLQEEVLSMRVLHFTESQPPEEEAAIIPADFEGTMPLYGGILRVYTSCPLTNEIDSLNAFLGLLARFKGRLFPLGFCHGLPLQSHSITLG